MNKSNIRSKQLIEISNILKYNKMKKINLIKNSKTPAMSWKNNNYLLDINMDRFNCGILTGKINNIIVVDVDEKDEGIEEFNKYTSKYGTPITLTQKTPNNGYHYIFSYNHTKPEVKYVIQNILTNKSKYRNGKGIDIRTNGGYIVGAPSTINGKSYEVNDIDISEMPEHLAYWLIESNEQPIIREVKIESLPITYTQNLIYDLTDDQIKEILDALPSNYNTDLSLWLAITNIMKNLNKYDLWDQWCLKNTEKYDKIKNTQIYNSCKGQLNINWLMSALNLPLILSHKPIPISDVIKPNKKVNHKYVSDCITYEEFKRNKSIVIKSCTGTGKTTMTATYTKRYLEENKGLQVLSITNLISLGLQHIDSFKKCDIKLVPYDDSNLDVSKDHIYSCVNSLYKILKDVNDTTFSNYIVYIDEITTFIECLTHNDLLDNNIKDIYRLLIKIIKNCHKIIVSDATINNNTFELLKHKDKPFYVVNEFKKFKDVPAINLKDENDFINKIRTNITNKEYFLFGSDWNGRISDAYNQFMNEFPDQKDSFLLITSDTKYKVGNASEQFKNKYVFYSPSITTAIDFSIDDKQDVFIYISGKSILPTGSYQQTTRTRNIRNLYYYSDAKTSKPFYNDYEALVNDYKSMTKTNKLLNDISLTVNENDDDVIVENTFFKIYTYNEYLVDCYNSNKNIHYKNILRENGFKISSEGNKKSLDKDVLESYKEVRESIQDALFDEYLKSSDRSESKFESINDRVEMLNITTDKDLETYQDIVKDKFKMENHLNTIRLLKSNEYIKIKLAQLTSTSFNVKIMSTVYNKLNLLNKVMYPNAITNIFTAETINYNINEDTYKIVKKVFRIERSKPTTKEEYLKLVASMIGNMSDIVDSHRKKTNKTTITTYSIDNDKIQYHINLDKLNNVNHINYSDYVKKVYNLQTITKNINYDERLDLKDIDEFDDDDIINV